MNSGTYFTEPQKLEPLLKGTDQRTLGNSLGVLEVGILLSAILYGTICMQVFAYFQFRFKDPGYIRLLVSIL
jgi:hypothetical protein